MPPVRNKLGSLSHTIYTPSQQRHPSYPPCYCSPCFCISEDTAKASESEGPQGLMIVLCVLCVLCVVVLFFRNRGPSLKAHHGQCLVRHGRRNENAAGSLDHTVTGACAVCTDNTCRGTLTNSYRTWYFLQSGGLELATVTVRKTNIEL